MTPTVTLLGTVDIDQDLHQIEVDSSAALGSKGT